MKTILFALAASVSLAAAAQTLKPPEAQAARPTEFPADATPLSVEQLKERVTGKTFNVTTHDGGGWKAEYKTNGYVFINTTGGYNASGPWEAQGSKLCSRLRGQDVSCNEMRLGGEVLYLKRDNGEVVRLVSAS